MIFSEFLTSNFKKSIFEIFDLSSDKDIKSGMFTITWQSILRTKLFIFDDKDKLKQLEKLSEKDQDKIILDILLGRHNKIDSWCNFSTNED